MNKRLKVKRNFDCSSINHPLTMHHSYVGYEYMGDDEKVVEYKQKLLSEGYNLWDVEDCFNFVNKFKGKEPKNRRSSSYFEIVHQGEAEYFGFLPDKEIFKIISFEYHQLYAYYFTFPHNLKLPEKSEVTEHDLAVNFVSWWDVVDDKTFFNPSFWQSINWVEKERGWK